MQTQHLSRCAHCSAYFPFDHKQLGETQSCPSCNQDTKLFSARTETVHEPLIHLLDPDEGPTVCCGRSIFKLPKDDRCTYDESEYTCPGADVVEVPPVMPKTAVAVAPKSQLHIWIAVIFTALAVCGACVIALTVNFYLDVRKGLDSQRSHTSIVSATAQEYGLRDHSTGQRRTAQQVTELARQLHIPATDVKDFTDGYTTGWNLIGKY